MGTCHAVCKRQGTALSGGCDIIVEMLDAFYSTTKRWVSQWVDDSPLPGSLTLAAVDAEINDLERRKDRHRRALDRLEYEYRDAARNVARLDGPRPKDNPELGDVHHELERVVEVFSERQLSFMRTLNALRALQRYALEARAQADDDGPVVDIDHRWLTHPEQAPRDREALDDWVTQILDEGPPFSFNHGIDWYEDTTVGDLAETVVTAARTTGTVPTLCGLLEGGGMEGDESGTIDVAADASAPGSGTPDR